MFSPKYAISDEMAIVLSDIERLTTYLKQSALPVPVLEHIKKQCLVALTHFSTQIEGNRLSMDEVSGVVEKNKSYGLLRDEKEVKNYFQSLEGIPGLMQNYGKGMSLELILRCHSDMLNGIVEKNLLGKFRDVQNAIYESGTNRLVYLPPEPKDILPLTNDLCSWVNEAKIHPVLLAGIFHNQFVTIHPFVDGNGRSARFLSCYLLDAMGYNWKQIVPVDRTYADHRIIYYQTLQQDYPHNYYDGRSRTDFTKWLEYYVDGIKRVLEGTISQVELYKTRNILINNRQARILKHLETADYITAPQYAKRFHISTRMAARDLGQLVQWDHLAVIGKARATKYFRKN